MHLKFQHGRYFFNSMYNLSLRSSRITMEMLRGFENPICKCRPALVCAGRESMPVCFRGQDLASVGQVASGRIHMKMGKPHTLNNKWRMEISSFSPSIRDSDPVQPLLYEAEELSKFSSNKARLLLTSVTCAPDLSVEARSNPCSSMKFTERHWSNYCLSG